MLPRSYHRHHSGTRHAHLIALVAASLFCLNSAHAASTKIDVDTDPPGATVYMVNAEGGETTLGQTPLSAKRVPRGQVALRFELTGYKGLVETIDVGSKSSRYVFKLTKDTQPGLLIFSSHETFHGAIISVNGKVIGSLPSRVSVPVGRHQASVAKEGYERWEQWLDITDGLEVPLDIVLTPKMASKGSVLVTSSPSGATIQIDGAPRGVTPTTISGLSPGAFQLVLTLDGHTPHTANLIVKDGEQAVIEATLKKAASRLGNIKVLADVEGALIALDGERVGAAPVARQGLEPGLHLVEATAPGHTGARREVTIRAGETTVVRLSLPKETIDKPASVRVVTAAPGAQVSVDGGPATPVSEPVSIQSAGTHFVTVTAPNYATWTKQITTSPGQSMELVAELVASGELFIEVSEGAEAEVLVDDSLAGMTPLKTPLAVGEHTVVVRRGSGDEERHTLSVTAGKSIALKVFKAKAAKAQTADGRAMPFSAKTVGTGRGSLDIALGWPYIGEMRINGGITPYLDIGFAFRNVFDTMSEFEGRVKYTFARSKVLAAAAEVSIGGGGGSLDRNSFIFRALVLGSVFIGDKVAMTARAGGFVFSDRLAPEGLTADSTLSPALGDDRRDTGLELHAGLTLEFAVSEEWNFFLLFDAMPIRTGSYQVTQDGEPVELQGRLLLYEGLAGEAKAQFFRAAVGSTLLF
ncbi:MAG: PEGA domain-containing protein [Myxococcota bacterium]